MVFLKRFVFVPFLMLILFLSASSAVTVRGSVHGQLLLAATDSWELGILWRPCVVKIGGTYMMWYSGETGNLLTDRIGLATSPDGVAWTKYPQNPVMTGTPGQWDEGSVNDEWVLYESGQYKMWYGGQTIQANGTVTSYQIGYATSPDGIHWTKYTGNPVLTQGPSGTWDDLYVHIPTVIRNGSSYIMYYRGTSTNAISALGMAASPDGVHWTKSGHPLTLAKSVSGWDTYQRVSDIIMVNVGYLMAYAGSPTPFPAPNGPSPKVKIGFASSPDGTNWTPYPDNPIIVGGSGTWDSGGVNYPMVLPAGDKMYVYYAAYATGQYEKSIGLVVLAAAQLPVPEYGSPVLIVVAVMLLAGFLIRPKRTLTARLQEQPFA